MNLKLGQLNIGQYVLLLHMLVALQLLFAEIRKVEISIEIHISQKWLKSNIFRR
jgi:hypothetical protein